MSRVEYRCCTLTLLLTWIFYGKIHTFGRIDIYMFNTHEKWSETCTKWNIEVGGRIKISTQSQCRGVGTCVLVQDFFNFDGLNLLKKKKEKN